MARKKPDTPPPPEMPTGWRSSRRGSRVRRDAEKAIRAHEKRQRYSRVLDLVRWGTRNGFYATLMGAGVLILIAVLVWGAALAINGAARWNAKRLAEQEASPEGQAERARDNLLVIGVTEGRASGFLAMRIVPDQQQVFGIAIPDGAFIEVPGQGFERIGDSFLTGPETSLAAVTNFFTVPFTGYAIVDAEAYQNALTEQSVARLLTAVQAESTNLSGPDLDRWDEFFAEVPSENVALIPMPVKPINVGTQTYFEPQREEIADLVSSWWGVAIDAEDPTVRVIVYNGSGEPGVAGQAAQLLIRGGFRVVDTKNADSFDYDVTQIVVQRGDALGGEGVREVLGVGEVVSQPADQEVADIIIIIGSDFEPPAPEAAE
ncbi:MAG: LytR C-terminal domain-containing protein [Anaerosomatales bacterium]|nr:LytR C-terminal domain-containing protein [Anaerosomatales bacterium]MDT8433541.1 LytR C-terminal domain-containing protein [Anaerosomatales bacterium]